MFFAPGVIPDFPRPTIIDGLNVTDVRDELSNGEMGKSLSRPVDSNTTRVSIA